MKELLHYFWKQLRGCLSNFVNPLLFRLYLSVPKELESALNTNEKSVEDQWTHLKTNLLKATEEICGISKYEK